MTSMTEEEPDYFSPSEILAVIRRHRIAAMVAGLTTLISIFVLGVWRTPLFDAQATLSLDLNQRTVTFNQQPELEQNSWSYAHELLRTQRNILLSKDLLQAALKTGGLSTNPGYVGIFEPLERLRSRFSITDYRDNWDLTLTFRDEDQNRAESSLQSILDTYRTRYADNQKQHSQAAVTFLEQQLDEAKRKMDQAKGAEQDFQESKGLVVLEADKSMAAVRLYTLSTRLNLLVQQLASLDILVAQIQANDAIADPDARLNAMLSLELVNRHPAVVEQQRLLFGLKSREVELEQKYLDKHPRMIEIRSQVADKIEHLREVVNSIRLGILADRTKLGAQLISLKEEQSKADAEFGEYRQNLFRLQSLSQEARANEQLYEHLLKRLGEERIAQHLDKQQLSETDSPLASSQPANIHIPVTVLAAVMGGILTGILAPLLLEVIGRRANSKSEIQALIGRPLLGELPNVPDLQGFGAHGDPNLPADLTEGIRSLRTALSMRQAKSDIGECLLITSCDPGDGKSTTAVRLAMNMAQAGRRVLLVDGDLRKPSLNLQLEQNCDKGLSSLLAGEPGISPAETTYANLFFLDAGAEIAQPGELLNSHCLTEWLEQSRREYDEIIIDSPPLSLFADGLILGNSADRILLVVREGSTRKESLYHCNQLLAPLADKLAGIAIISRPGQYRAGVLYHQFKIAAKATAQTRRVTDTGEPGTRSATR